MYYFFGSVFTKYIREAEDNLRDRNKDILVSLSKDNIPLLEVMMLQEGMYPEDILTVFLDMMIIGVNAVRCIQTVYNLARYICSNFFITDQSQSCVPFVPFGSMSKGSKNFSR